MTKSLMPSGCPSIIFAENSTISMESRPENIWRICVFRNPVRFFYRAASTQLPKSPPWSDFQMIIIFVRSFEKLSELHQLNIGFKIRTMILSAFSMIRIPGFHLINNRLIWSKFCNFFRGRRICIITKHDLPGSLTL